MLLHFISVFSLLAVTSHSQDYLTCLRNNDAFENLGVTRPTSSKGGQGAPGKRGPEGKKGDHGIKGSRGESGQPDLEEIARLQRRITTLEKKLQTQISGCPSIQYSFPRANQVADFVRYRSYFPKMKETTLCLWVDSNNFGSTVASYATRSSDNELVFQLILKNSISFYKSGVLVRRFATTSLTSFSKYHLCVWFSNRLHQSGLYLNGQEVERVTDNGNEIRGGGDLLLGQEQDGINAGRLDAGQSFRGNITNFMMWPRVLSGDEISRIVRNCECPKDYAIVMTPDRAEIHGKVEYILPDTCPTLLE